MNCDELEPKSICGPFGDSSQLMLGHFPMRIIINSFDFAAVFDWSDYAPKLRDRARAGDVACPCRKRMLCHRNFTKAICHAFKLVATVTDSELSSHKRRYKNEYESM